MGVFTHASLYAAVACSLLLYGFFVVVYRLTFHPLAKYPGPFLWRISGWPDGLSANRGTRALDHYHLHERYGDVVRYSPSCLSFRTATALHSIHADRKANVIKAGWIEASIAINHTTSTLSEQDKHLHASRRGLISHAFSDSALRAAERYVLEMVRDWCARLGDGESKEMSMWSLYLTLDVLGELCFGSNFGAIEAGGSHMTETMMANSTLYQKVASLPIRQWLYPFLNHPRIAPLLGGKVNRNRLAQRRKMRDLIVERRNLQRLIEAKGVEDRKDFFHYLLNARDPETGTGPGDKDLVQEAAVLVGAGTDTSATALASLLFYLSQPINRRALEQLQVEIRDAFDHVESIVSGPTLNECLYLRACIDEALRMTPPIPGILERKVLPGGIVIDGDHIPQGCVVGTSSYSTHHNENLYPRSFDFIPERWIEGSTDARISITPSSVHLAKTAFSAFSAGPRGCVGKSMAYLELELAVARLIYTFDFQEAAEQLQHVPKYAMGSGVLLGREGEFKFRDHFVIDRFGPTLVFTPRSMG